MIIKTIVLDNIRSVHNVGSILRTAEGYGIGSVIFCGLTPFPALPDDHRLPHIIKRLSIQIHKTALGAEERISFRYIRGIADATKQMRQAGLRIVALENLPSAIDIRRLPDDTSPACLIVGNEIDGIAASVLKAADIIVRIPMLGRKHSFNVAVAAAIALERLSSVAPKVSELSK